MDAPSPSVPGSDKATDAERRSLDEVREALGQDFDVLRQLGKGAMATVYLARDRALGVLVAIKVLRPGRAADETARRRFEREARAAASLAEHPNVVAVRRFGRLPDETPYLVMQYVKGRTMEERLKAEGRLSVAETRQVLRAVASALHVAHAKGIVHRDPRPGNVLWDEEGRKALLTDFGIAAVLATGGEEVTRLTKTGQLLGDPRYLSPEQLMDQDLTELADIYLLGVLGYELLTGEGPYEARTNTEVITAHLSKEPRDLRSLREDVDRPLADLLKRCLAREANHRPSAGDVVRILDGFEVESRGTGPGHDDLAEVIKRRVPQIVGLAVVVSLGLIAIADALSDLIGNVGVVLTIVFSAALVVTSGVVAWFHGERGKQRAPIIEWIILGLIFVAWLAVSTVVVTWDF